MTHPFKVGLRMLHLATLVTFMPIKVNEMNLGYWCSYFLGHYCIALAMGEENMEILQQLCLVLLTEPLCDSSVNRGVCMLQTQKQRRMDSGHRKQLPENLTFHVLFLKECF